MEQLENNTKNKFSPEYQTKILTCLLLSRDYFEQMYDLIDVKYWDNDSNKWIVKEGLDYYKQYKNLITPLVYKAKFDELGDGELKSSVIDQLKSIYDYAKDSDLPFIKEQFLEFCKNQKLKNAIEKSLDYLESGQYDKIKMIVDDAMKAGMERNLGHDYLKDLEKRMTEASRDTMKTGWPLIDALTNGGAGKKELWCITGAGGSGKCVGPNTEIEIQYYETGIPIQGNSGTEYIIWIKPYEKYEFLDKRLYGWQINNVLFELEKMKMERQDKENK